MCSSASIIDKLLLCLIIIIKLITLGELLKLLVIVHILILFNLNLIIKWWWRIQSNSSINNYSKCTFIKTSSNTNKIMMALLYSNKMVSRAIYKQNLQTKEFNKISRDSQRKAIKINNNNYSKITKAQGVLIKPLVNPSTHLWIRKIQ